MASNDMTNLTGLLEQIGNSDPQLQQKLQLISTLMNNNNSASENEEELDQRRRIRARKKLQRLYREYEILKERNEDLAAALGACPHCWGENSRCKICHGEGSPGYFTVDEEAFTEYVMPVLEQLGLLKHESNSVAQTDNTGD